jgi:hypothetical protein
MDEGEPHCADYVYVWSSPGCDVRVTSARVAGDEAAAGDATLFPSDHFALHVRLSVARRGGAAPSVAGAAIKAAAAAPLVGAATAAC